MSVLVGDQTGLIKEVVLGSLVRPKPGQDVDKDGKRITGTSTSRVADKFGSQQKDRGVVHMCWIGPRGREEESFATLLKSGVIEVWSPRVTKEKPVLTYKHPFVPPKEPEPEPKEDLSHLSKAQRRRKRAKKQNPTKAEIIGKKVPMGPPPPPPMIGLESSSSSSSRLLLSGSQDGVVVLSALKTASFGAQQVKTLKKFEVGKDVCRIRLEKLESKEFASGGKEQLLRLWDIETGTVKWKARNVPHDWLELRVPVWIRDIGYRPKEVTQLATVTAHKQIRLFDINQGKRAVMDLEVGDSAFTCMCFTADGNYLTVGDSVGGLSLIDIRTGKNLGLYRGSGGAVKSIMHHPDRNTPLTASVSLDRFLKIHHTHTRKLLKKIYLKQKLDCVLFKSETCYETQEEYEEDAEAGDVWAELDKRAATAGLPKDVDTEGEAQRKQGKQGKKSDAEEEDQGGESAKEEDGKDEEEEEDEEDEEDE